jgi:hypothetical protein
VYIYRAAEVFSQTDVGCNFTDPTLDNTLLKPKLNFMRHIIFILTISFFIMSCGQNDTKQKELELKERELALKEKELALKQDTANSKNPTQAITDTIQKNIAATPSLTVSPLNISGDLGQVTFSQKSKTIFYYNFGSKKGKIKLNGTEYILDKYSENYGSFKLSGAQVSINAPNCKYGKEEGGDCFYGKFSLVTITLGTDILKLNKVEVQNCPSY